MTDANARRGRESHSDTRCEGPADALSDRAKGIARDANDHPLVRAMARTGYAASGLMHLLIGWVAIGIARHTNDGQATADQSGAFTEISQLPGGTAVLWIMTIGFAGLALWQCTEVIGGWHGPGKEAAGSRMKAVSKAVVYALLALGSFRFAVGGNGGTSSRTQSASATATVLDQPGGQILVVLVGLVVVGVGVYHVVKGFRRTFLPDLIGRPGLVAQWAGVIGYAAKGAALTMVGVLLAAAGFSGNTGPSRGLDGALRAFASTSPGAIALLLIGAGIALYGVYSFFRARFTKV